MDEFLSIPRPHHSLDVQVRRAGEVETLTLTYENTHVYRYTDPRYEHMNHVLHSPAKGQVQYLANEHGLIDRLIEHGYPGTHMPAPNEAALLIYVLNQDLRLARDLGKLGLGDLPEAF